MLLRCIIRSMWIFAIRGPQMKRLPLCHLVAARPPEAARIGQGSLVERFNRLCAVNRLPERRAGLTLPETCAPSTHSAFVTYRWGGSKSVAGDFPGAAASPKGRIGGQPDQQKALSISPSPERLFNPPPGAGFHFLQSRRLPRDEPATQAGAK